MTKLQDMIKDLKTSGKTVTVHKPGFGYVSGTVDLFTDDVVIVKVDQPTNQKNFVIHYSQFCMEKT